MKMKKTRLLKVIAFALIMIACIAFVNAKEINLSENPNAGKEKSEISFNYFSKYFTMIKQLPNSPKIKQLLEDWKKEAPTGDYYFCYYYEAVRVNVDYKDNSSLVSENQACIIDGDYYIFKDSTIYWPGLWNGINELIEGVHYFSNRLDLWQNLMNILAETVCYQDLKTILLQYLYIVEQSKKKDVQWFESNDKLLSDRNNYTNDEEILFETLFTYANYFVDSYRVRNSVAYYEEVYRKAIEVFPENAIAYNEVGYAIGTRNPTEALFYFEKAYEMDKTNLHHVLNCGIYSHLVKDNKKDEKYKKAVYETKDENLIKIYEENIEAIDDGLYN